MEHGYIYDIRTSENAMATLVNFTGVVPPIWEEFIKCQNQYRYNDDLVEDVIIKHGHMPPSYENWLFTYFHVTTSANECKMIKTYGLLDLKNAYRCRSSELRIFLDNKGIEIDLDNCLLKYKGHFYNIEYGKMPFRTESKEYACWSIGRKFYYDFTNCGFLSVLDRSPYAGNVHCRPEILSDIDNLLNLSLSQEWHISHKPYEILAIVNGSDIVYDGDDNQSDKEKIITYLTKAYNTAFGEPFEEIVLLKNDVQVPPEQIIDITPLHVWR